MIDIFGRLPVHEHQWVQHVIAIPGAGSAYESVAVTAYQGPVGNSNVFQHETDHAMVFYKNNGVQSSDQFYFLAAINADTCVTDYYANTNNVQDWAQLGVIILYEIVTPGGLDTLGVNWRCIEMKKNVVDAYQSDNMYPGGTCDRRWSDSETVSMGPTSGNGKRDANGKRQVAAPKPVSAGPQMGQENVFEVPDKHHSGVTSFPDASINHTQRAAGEARQKHWAKQAKRSERLSRYDEKA